MSPNRIFVAYPWVPYDRDDYKSRYRALEQKHDVIFEFAEDRLTTDQLIAKVEKMMSQVDFCILDLTDLNFNVALEYGLARGLRLEAYIAFHKTINNKEVPSDLRGLDSLRYQSLDELQSQLDSFLAQALSSEERLRRGQQPRAAAPDAAKYTEEVSSEPASELLRKIRSRGHWTTLVRPERYVPGRIPYRSLAGTIGDAKVEGRGFTFPHTDTFGQFPQLGGNWFGREFEIGGYFIEHWRLFESGQFFHVRALAEDWPENLPNGELFPPTGTGVAVVGAAKHVADAFEFAAGLGASLPGVDPIVLRLTLEPLSGRVLMGSASVEDPFLDQQLNTRQTAMSKFEREWTLPREELKKKVEKTWVREEVQKTWRPIALDAMRGFYDRFGWDPGDARLRRWANLSSN